MNRELPNVQTRFRKGRGTRDQIANLCGIMAKAREFQKNIYYCFIDYLKPLTMKGHPKLSNINKMKRERNTQQVKEQDKCPPNQTKKEEIGNLHDKEFQIVIVKMIQNLEIKMESQVSSLETRIEKMQERFNKDLEEIKKSQYIMNNAINEIKNTLEATNSRI